MDDAELRLRVGVRDLLATYQFLADSGKTRELARLFLPDAMFENNTAKLVGHDAILDFFERTGEAFISTGLIPARHHLSSVHITPKDDGSAATYACFQLIGVRGLDHWGTYRDEVVSTADGWRFARRKAKVEGHVEDSPTVDLLGLR
ncbi:nuclear transport factor 2 family protein [Mycolicibacterium sp. XJ1819]